MPKLQTLMKVRLTYIIALLISILSLAARAEAAGKPISKSDLEYGVPTNAYCGARITTAINSRLSSQPDGEPARGATGAQIQQAPDVAMQGSIVPVCDVTLLLIGVLHLQETESFLQIVEPPNRQVLFKILFQVIIAPNAP